MCVKKWENQNYGMRNSSYKNRESRDSKIEKKKKKLRFSKKDYQVGRIGIENANLLFKYWKVE